MSAADSNFVSNPPLLPKNADFSARLDAICRRAERRLAALSTDERFRSLQNDAVEAFDSASFEPESDVSFVVRLGSATLTLEEVAAFDVDSIVPLTGGSGGSVQIWANGRLCGRGTLLASRGKIAVKIEEIDPDAAFDQ